MTNSTLINLIQKVITPAAVVTTAAFSMLTAPAMAATLSVTQSNSSTLLNELLGTTTGLSNFSVTTTGNAAAFGKFSNDTVFGLGSGIVLSTGKAVDVVGPNNAGGKGTSFGTPGDTSNSYDLAKLDISFDADSTADKLFFEYVFGSEEFLEYGGSQFNDSFELLLNGVNLAKLTNGNTVTINNLVPNPSGSYNPDFINNTNGITTNETQLDGYTKKLAFEGLLNKNAKNTLSIKIKDQGDGVWDSAVLIKGKSLGTVKPVEKVPEPSVVFGLLTLGGMAFLKNRKQQRTVKA